MKINFLNFIEINIDDNYKWKDSLFIDKKIYIKYNNNSSLTYKIKIKYSNKIDYSKAREIEKNLYCCNEYFYDNVKHTKIYFENNEICVIETDQECNEWLVIVIQIMLLKQRKSIIHAAAVEKEGKGFLFPSWGGVGKTACVSKLIEKGYKLLGDDLNIISGDGTIIGLPKKFVLYFYHKELFPEIFKKYSVKANSAVNKFYSNIIPTVKAILRRFPGLLSYARKHNPQSIKVSPYEIFKDNQIIDTAKIDNIMWLERNNKPNEYKSSNGEDIAFKAVSVTINELFTDNLNAILIMCGFRILKYEEVFLNMSEIYNKAFQVLNVGILNIDKKLHVSNVPIQVLKVLDNRKE